MKKRFSFKKTAGVVHLWLGLASGLLLFIICLTGTIYVFEREIQEWTSPEKFKVDIPSPDAKHLSPDELITTLQNKKGKKVVWLRIPEAVNRTYQVGMIGDDEKIRSDTGLTSNPIVSASGLTSDKRDKQQGKKIAAKVKKYYVNPYTGTIAGEETNTGFFPTVLRLHRWFLLPKSVGSVIGGVAVITFVFIILSGLVIWLPAKLKRWKQGLKIKYRAGWKRVNHDLHKSFGFYAAIFLLGWALTGLCWSFNWYKNGVSKVLSAKVFSGSSENIVKSKSLGSEKIPVSQLLQIANTVLPYSGDYFIQLPADTTGTVVIFKNKTGFFAVAAADKVQIDAVTGEVLKVEKFIDKRWNEKIALLIKPLHTGEIFGTFSKIIYFIICLISTSLPVTGTLIWWNKRKKKNRAIHLKYPAEEKKMCSKD